MPTFLFKCPSTGYRVQGFVAQEDETTDPGVFVPVNCPVCSLLGVLVVIVLLFGSTLFTLNKACKTGYHRSF